MKTLLSAARIALCLLFLFPVLAAPSSAQTSAESEKQIRTLIDGWATARVKGDVAFLEKFYAKEFRIIGADGSIAVQN